MACVVKGGKPGKYNHIREGHFGPITSFLFPRVTSALSRVIKLLASGLLGEKLSLLQILALETPKRKGKKEEHKAILKNKGMIYGSLHKWRSQSFFLNFLSESSPCLISIQNHFQNPYFLVSKTLFFFSFDRSPFSPIFRAPFSSMASLIYTYSPQTLSFFIERFLNQTIKIPSSNLTASLLDLR